MGKRKKGFDLADPATLIGFIIGLLGTFLFGLVTGIIILIVVTIVFAIFLGILDYVFSNAIVGLSRVL